MSQLVPLDEVCHFDVVTHHPGTGAITDADSTPTFDVYEEATDTGLLGATNFTKRTSLTGNYRGTFTASAANGFEAGKWYSVIGSATVNAIAAKTVAMHFRVAPAESSAGVPKGDVSHWGGSATPVTNFTTVFSTDFAAAYNTTTDTWNVNATHVSGTAQTAGDIMADINSVQTTLGTPASDISADILAVKTDTAGVGTLLTRVGVPSNLGGGATVAANLADIEGQTDDIGAAGAGLTALATAASVAAVQDVLDNGVVAANVVEVDGSDTAAAKLSLYLSAFATGTADNGSTTTMVDAARTEGDADYWKGQELVPTSGAIFGQGRQIIDFDEAADEFTVDRAWTQSMGAGITYIIRPASRVDANMTAIANDPVDTGSDLPQVDVVEIDSNATSATNASSFWLGAISHTGTAQAGGASTITLASGASSVNDFYNKAAVTIVSGTGAGQTRQITAYVGSTRVATVDTAWVTNPDNTSVYQVIGRIV